MKRTYRTALRPEIGGDGVELVGLGPSGERVRCSRSSTSSQTPSFDVSILYPWADAGSRDRRRPAPGSTANELHVDVGGKLHRDPSRTRWVRTSAWSWPSRCRADWSMACAGPQPTAVKSGAGERSIRRHRTNVAQSRRRQIGHLFHAATMPAVRQMRGRSPRRRRRRRIRAEGSPGDRVVPSGPSWRLVLGSPSCVHRRPRSRPHRGTGVRVGDRAGQRCPSRRAGAGGSAKSSTGWVSSPSSVRREEAHAARPRRPPRSSSWCAPPLIDRVGLEDRVAHVQERRVGGRELHARG